MKQALTTLLTACCSALLLTACEKPLSAENDGNSEIVDPNNVKVRFNADKVDNEKFDATNEASRASAQSLNNVCSRISMAIFDSDGNKIKTVNQTSADSKFGHFDISIAKGDYSIVFIAHNGSGNPTISSPDEIKFANNKVTDTFYYYSEITIDNNSDYNITLQRATAMFRLVVRDTTPNSIKQMKFYYTGGSSTLDATTGCGCVNSKQTEYRTVSSTAYTGESEYEVYTFPHDSEKAMNFEVSAQNGTSANSTVKYTKTFEKIYLKRNTITQYSGYFYGEAPEGGRGFDIRIDDEWEQENFEY